MPQNDAISKALSSAKAELGRAGTFPSTKSAASAAPKAASVKPAPTVGDELAAKAANVKQYTDSLPKMHNGGRVPRTGAYVLKAGEHVLTAPQTKMVSQMNSSAKSIGAPTPKPTPIVPANHPMSNSSVTILPKMHDGGPVLTDGAYELKAGEHVLTESQAKMARKHALMSIGMKRLSKSAKTDGEPAQMDAAHKKPEKKVTSHITVRPEPKKTPIPHGRGEK